MRTSTAFVTRNRYSGTTPELALWKQVIASTVPRMPSRRSATAFVPSGSRRHTAQSILEAWRAGKTDATMRSYSHDLAAVAAFMTTGFELAPALSIDAALERLFRDYDSAGAHGLVLAFRA